MTRTFHLTPAEIWEETDPGRPYAAPSLASEGFIHCTDGADAMVVTANRFYATDPRDFVVLTIDLERVGSPWRYDEPGSPYPHVYGPIDRQAIVGAVGIPRGSDGRFLPFPATD